METSPIPPGARVCHDLVVPKSLTDHRWQRHFFPAGRPVEHDDDRRRDRLLGGDVQEKRPSRPTRVLRARIEAGGRDVRTRAQPGGEQRMRWIGIHGATRRARSGGHERPSRSGARVKQLAAITSPPWRHAAACRNLPLPALAGNVRTYVVHARLVGDTRSSGRLAKTAPGIRRRAIGRRRSAWRRL